MVIPERATLIRAAEYVRMSTEHQRYSIENQQAGIAEYAAEHGMSVVATFADAGKSGVTLAGRAQLKLLLQKIIAGGADFEALLVYDVSRWGRFQDADEAAHYEFLCRSNGVQVIYCAEPFENDGTPLTTIYKGIKRAMAGEYSRELSKKTTAGKLRVVSKGYFYGGPPGYGLRRMQVDQHGHQKGLLGQGERKNMQSDGVVLVLGPPEEIALVRRIYDLFVDEGLGCSEIARLLTDEGLASATSNGWNHYSVREILTNEKYIGNLVFNRTESRLGSKVLRRPREQWLRIRGAHPAIVDELRFKQAQAIFGEYHLSREEILSRLRALYLREGRLTQNLISRDISLPSLPTFALHFGNLFNAYALVGFRPPVAHILALTTRMRRREERLAGGDMGKVGAAGPPHKVRLQQERMRRYQRSRRSLRELHITSDQMLVLLRDLYKAKGKLSAAIIAEAKGVPSDGTYRTRFGSLFAAYRLVGYEPDPKDVVGMGRAYQERERRRHLEAAANGQPLYVDPLRLDIEPEDPPAQASEATVGYAYLHMTDKEMLEGLRELLARAGTLTTGLIDEDQDLPCSRTYAKRFGSLFAAYRQVGFVPLRRHVRASDARQRMRIVRARVATDRLGLSSKRPNDLGESSEQPGQSDQNPIVDNDHSHTSA